jgi:hypothetical protein
MNDPIRNDIFEDANGVQVAVKQLYAPNAIGVCFVEYKNLSDSNLRFMPKEQFLESFHWVDNFGSTDTFVKVDLKQEAKLPANTESAESAGGAVETIPTEDAVDSEVAKPVEDDDARSSAPTRSS